MRIRIIITLRIELSSVLYKPEVFFFGNIVFLSQVFCQEIVSKVSFCALATGVWPILIKK